MRRTQNEGDTNQTSEPSLKLPETVHVFVGRKTSFGYRTTGLNGLDWSVVEGRTWATWKNHWSGGHHGRWESRTLPRRVGRRRLGWPSACVLSRTGQNTAYTQERHRRIRARRPSRQNFLSQRVWLQREKRMSL